MNSGRSLRILSTAALGMAIFAAAPAFAQDSSEAELDVLIERSLTPGDALDLARKQEGEGDLLGAAATIERALLTNPEGTTSKVRLYYVALLCRLDDKQTARSELGKINGLSIGNGEWSAIQSACGDLPRPPVTPRRERQGLTGEVAIGLAYDSDLANALLVNFDLPGAVVREDGASVYGSAYVLGRTLIGRRGFAYAGLGGATKNSIAGPDLSFQTFDGQVGFGFEGDGFELSAGFTGGHSLISSDPFLTEYGGEAELAVVLAGDARLSVRGEIVHQDYMGSTAIFSRDGTRIDAGLDYQRRDGLTSYWFGASFEKKTSETARTGYRGLRGFGSLRSVIAEPGTYVSLYGTLRYVEYEDEAGFVPVNEVRWYSRAAIGIPVLTNGLNLEAGASYSWRVYNQASGFQNYKSVGGELRLVWNFGN
ncbi:hypothetical protein P1X14_14220 [Sphingomonas sp. AOB5]|uniref:hypothetical protein n=1 Tax=Sphingomonas sp. AOB5 TaxID=3034017 RepID=UPI0023F7DB70|nr:hypothetical protein [Sphingomonas sp. AOB5]MDF7776406.1 hypothetical protein [Sphingomonas sp. AOB5]